MLAQSFKPAAELGRMQRIKPAQAAIALRNYLTCGEAKWDEVLG